MSAGNLVPLHFIFLSTFLIGLIFSNAFFFNYFFAFAFCNSFSKLLHFYSNMFLSSIFCCIFLGISLPSLLGLCLAFLSFHFLWKQFRDFEKGKADFFLVFKKIVFNRLFLAIVKNFALQNLGFVAVGFFGGYYFAQFLFNLGFFQTIFFSIPSSLFISLVFGAIFLSCEFTPFLYGFVTAFGFFLSYKTGILFFIPSIFYLYFFIFVTSICIIHFYKHTKNLIGELIREHKFDLTLDRRNGTVSCDKNIWQQRPLLWTSVFRSG